MFSLEKFRNAAGELQRATATHYTAKIDKAFHSLLEKLKSEATDRAQAIPESEVPQLSPEETDRWVDERTGREAVRQAQKFAGQLDVLKRSTHSKGEFSHYRTLLAPGDELLPQTIFEADAIIAALEEKFAGVGGDKSKQVYRQMRECAKALEPAAEAFLRTIKRFGSARLAQRLQQDIQQEWPAVQKDFDTALATLERLHPLFQHEIFFCADDVDVANNRLKRMRLCIGDFCQAGDSAEWLKDKQRYVQILRDTGLFYDWEEQSCLARLKPMSYYLKRWSNFTPPRREENRITFDIRENLKYLNLSFKGFNLSPDAAKELSERISASGYDDPVFQQTLERIDGFMRKVADRVLLVQAANSLEQEKGRGGRDI